MSPFTATLCAELIVVSVIIIAAAIITNMGAISSAVQSLGWF